MANRRFIDFPIASTVNDNDIVLIWQDGLNKQTTKGTLIQGAPTSLEGLTDVDIAGLINGQILQYNSTTGKWENVDRTDINLSQLGDVSIVSPSNGQVLVYNSSTSKWENSSGGYVPYTGAVTTVDLGAQGLRAGYIRFDTTIASVPDEQGLMYWDDSKSTAALIMNGTTQHIGQDTFFYVKNSTGFNIAKGVAVRFDGTDGASGHLKIAPFLADGTYPSTYFMGVTAEAIDNGEFGQVMHFGELDGIDTSGFTAGSLLYASTTSAGGFQTTAPVAPNNIVLIAAAVNSKNNGAIIVRPTYGSNINQDEGVKITSPTTGDLLQLQAGGLWENKTKAQILGGTASQFVKGDGSLDSTSYQPLLTNPVTGTGTTNYVARFTSSSSIGNGLIFDNGTSVGINTITPNASYPLDVNGFIRGTGYGVFSNSLNVGFLLRHSDWTGVPGSNNLAIASNQGSLTFFTNGSATERMQLTSGGNLLVGTGSDAGFKLDVNGTGRFTNTLIPIILRGTNASTMWTEYYYNTSTLSGFIGSGSGLLSGANASDFIVRSEADFVVATGGNNRRLTIASTGAATFSNTLLTGGDITVSKSGDSGINLNTTTTNGVAVTRYQTTAAGSLWATGINITGADSRWEIYNFALNFSPFRISTTGAATFSSSVTAADLIISDTYANDPLIKLASTTSGNAEVQIRTATTTYNPGIGVVTSGYDFNLFTNNTPRLTISSTGAATFNLGSGEMRLNRTGTSEFLKLNTYYLLSDGNDQLLGSVTGATSIYAGNGVSPRLTITSSGNVLIGTTTDNGFKLDVNGTGAFGLVGNVIFTKPNGSSYSRFLYSGSNVNVVFTGGTLANNGAFGINNFEDSVRLFNILNSGAATFSSSVSVATFAQFNGTTLRLGNDSNSGYNSIAFQGNSADGYNKIFAGSSTNDGVYIAAKTGQGIRFWVNGSAQALFINSSQAATFSSSVTTGDILQVGSGGGGGGVWTWGGSDAYIYSPTGKNLWLSSGSSGTNGLKIATTGAALFSNSVTATAFFQSSDLRKKDIIKRENDVVYFTWKDGEDKREKVGYIAQEIQKYMPNAVNEDTDGMLSVDYIQVLVSKILVMEKEIENLKNRK